MLLAKTLKSSTFKLAMFCVAAFSTAVFALLGYVYWATTNYMHANADHDISAERAQLIQAFERAGREGLVGLIAERVSEQRFKGTIYFLFDPQAGPLAGNIQSWPPALKGTDGWTDLTVPRAGSDAAATPLRVAYETLPDGSRLLIGRDIDDLQGFVGAIRVALASGAVLTFVLAAVAGISVTRRTVGRIEAINVTTAEIMRRGLGKRIPIRGTRDEWDQLAENLNAMLGRIEELVREVKQVSDNVAHDLRTPLTRLRGRLEIAYHDRLDLERYHALVGDAIVELDNVLRTFSSLLRISRIETVDPQRAFRIVDLGKIAGEVTELFDAAAEEKGNRIGFESDGSALAIGDRDLLFDAISNLIDNAIKHGGPDDVSVSVANDSQGPAICVADHGPGIPASEREQVLKRFYRLERSRSSPGNGLGLSLVAAVAQLHGASLELGDNEPGLKVWLRFPSADSPPLVATIDRGSHTKIPPNTGKSGEGPRQRFAGTSR